MSQRSKYSHTGRALPVRLPQTQTRRIFNGRWVMHGSALVLAAAVAACGGGGGESGASEPPPPSGNGGGGTAGGGSGVTPTSYTVRGTISGAQGAVQLALNGVSQTFSGSAFQFSQALPVASGYNVTVVAPGSGTACSVRNGAGTGAVNVSDVQVVCVAQTAVIRAADAQTIGTMAVGDYNGDGRKDLAFVIRTLDTHPTGGNNYFVRFLMGAGDGTFAAPVDVPTFCSGVPIRSAGQWAVTADFNGDGNDDLYCHGPDTGFQVFGGARNGAPTVLANLPFQGGSYNVAPLDVNRDGFVDVLGIAPYGGPSSSPFSYLPNNSGAGFSSVQFFQGTNVGVNDGSSFEIADFNGDGVLDVLVMTGNCAPSCRALGVFTGNGPAQFNTPSAFSQVPNATFAGRSLLEMYWSLASGDIDGDGDVDVITSSSTTFVQVMLNDGTGKFTPGDQVTVGTNPVRVALADFDGDGRLDILSADAGSRTLTVAFGLGGGKFGTASTPGNRWKQVTLDPRVNIMGMRITDLNGNGFPDVVVVENNMPRGNTNFGLGSVVVALDIGR